MASKASQLLSLGFLALAFPAFATEITISETDNTQNAINAAIADNPDIDVLVFSEGTYNFSGQVSTESNLALRGSPPPR